MKLFRKIILYLVGVIIVLCLIGFISGRVYFETLLPKTSGTISIPVLKKPVSVIRDQWGIPHIEAENEDDANVALGFVIAQDRLFQMEMQRRLAGGELSEIVGQRTVYFDKFFRTLGFRRKAAEQLKDLKGDAPESLQALDNFLKGVNYFIDNRKLPAEFLLLNAATGRDFTPRHFTRIDCMSLAGYMAYSFAEGFKTDSLAKIMEEKFPKLNTDQLFPGYSKEKIKVTIAETQAFYGTDPKIDGVPDKKTGGQKYKKKASLGIDLPEAGLKKLLAVVNDTLELAGGFEGSNSWVVGPSRSKTGQAILANDPHIAFQNPGIWYEAHVRYPGYENYGHHLALIPFPLIAHNKDKAWALTMLENDDLDLYTEQFDNQKKKVKYKGQWVDYETITETVKVVGQDGVVEEQELQIRITNHGPVITDFLKGYKGPPVSVEWVFLKSKTNAVDAFYKMGKAATMEAFEKAISQIEAPGLNVSYADAKGNIAWWAAGRFVRHRPGVNPKKILNGASGQEDNLGYAPFKQNPRLINPPSGVIITANNMASLKLPQGVPDAGYWQASDRAARLVTLFGEKRKFSIRDMKRIQTDNFSYSGPDIVASLVGTMEIRENLFKKLNDMERETYLALKGWNYENDPDSVGAMIYHQFNARTIWNLIGDEFGRENFNTYSRTADQWNFYKSIINRRKSSFWDNQDTERPEKRWQIILKSLQETTKELTNKFGEDVNDWQWGNVHTLELVHPLGRQKPLNYIFNIGPRPAPGGSYIVNNQKYYLDKPFVTKTGPSTRRIINFDNIEESYAILPSGNSGNFLSSHYDDQIDLYLAGKYRVLNYSKKQIQASASDRLTLVPN